MYIYSNSSVLAIKMKWWRWAGVGLSVHVCANVLVEAFGVGLFSLNTKLFIDQGHSNYHKAGLVFHTLPQSLVSSKRSTNPCRFLPDLKKWFFYFLVLIWLKHKITKPFKYGAIIHKKTIYLISKIYFLLYTVESSRSCHIKHITTIDWYQTSCLILKHDISTFKND